MATNIFWQYKIFVGGGKKMNSKKDVAAQPKRLGECLQQPSTKFRRQRMEKKRESLVVIRICCRICLNMKRCILKNLTMQTTSILAKRNQIYEQRRSPQNMPVLQCVAVCSSVWQCVAVCCKEPDI